MIISGLMNLIYNFFELILSPINIEAMPDGSVDKVHNFFDILFTSSESVIGLLVPNICFILIGIIIGIEIGIHLYHFVMWILRKIPMLGIN